MAMGTNRHLVMGPGMPEETLSTHPSRVIDFPTASVTTGGSGGGGGLEARVAKLQSDVEHVQSDISEVKGDLRKLLGAGIVAALGLMAMMATGFGWFGGG